MRYKYQMHLHTAVCSGCGRQTTEETIEALREGGYKGCVLTNHFKHGNTAVSRSLPWNEFVAAYEDEWLNTKKEAEKYDMDIIFGIEEGIGGGREILCYGITPKILYDNPCLDTLDINVWSKILRQNGALCIQAHPYRQRDYITNPGLEPLSLIDGIEVYNYSNDETANIEAEETAREHQRLILTSGGDAHNTERDCHGGIETEKRIKTGADLVRILKAGTYNLIKE